MAPRRIVWGSCSICERPFCALASPRPFAVDEHAAVPERRAAAREALARSLRGIMHATIATWLQEAPPEATFAPAPERSR